MTTLNLKGIQVERLRHFGDVHIGLSLWKRLGLEEFCREHIPSWKSYELKIEIKSPLLSNDPIAVLFDAQNHDAVVYKKQCRKNGGIKEGFIKFTGSNTVNISNLPPNTPDRDFNPHWDICNIWALNKTHNKERCRNSLAHEYPRPYLGFVKDSKEYQIDKRCERIFDVTNESSSAHSVSQKIHNQYKDILKDYKNNYGHIHEKFW